MYLRIFAAALFFLLGRPLLAQTLISQMGPVLYFNSLDSSKSALFTKIAQRCYCVLNTVDSSHTIQLRMDLATIADTFYLKPDSTRAKDTSDYKLSYDNLNGNTAQGGDTTSTGIYLKIRDTSLNEENILRLLYYALQHISELKKLPPGTPLLDRAAMDKIFVQKPSTKWKRISAYCK